MPSATVRTTRWAPVGTPAASMISLANALEPSSRAAAATGPKQRTPSAASASARPATSGASGPTTTRSMPASRAARASAAGSSAGASSARASRRMPAFPGAHRTSGACGERSERADERVLAPARADDEDPHTAPMKSSIGIAGIDS